MTADIEYITKCRLSLENYLRIEKDFFEFADTIYIWDQWGKKKEMSTLSLANLLINTCIGLEETLKLLLTNPKNNLNKKILTYTQIKHKNSSDKWIKKYLHELENENYSNTKIIDLLDFSVFRSLLNKSSSKIIYIRPPMSINFSDDLLFGNTGKKPKWYDAYEDVKHNIFSTYSKASIELVFDALAAYFLLAKIIAHEASPFEPSKETKEYFPWTEGEINIDNRVTFPTSPHWLSHFKSKHFININIKKKVKN